MKYKNHNKLRKKLKLLVAIIKPFYHIGFNIIHNQELEKKRSFGTYNSSKTIYIIRSRNETAGLYSVLNTVLEHLLYCDEMGYIPVVDMQNYKNSYLPVDRIGKDNSWEYYFEQPHMDDLQVDITTAYKSKNVILSNMAPIVKGHHIPDDIVCENSQVYYEEFKRIYQKQIRVKKELVQVFDNAINELFCGKRVLGVLCRGTDYIKLKPYNHPIQPSCDDVIELTKKKIEEWECDLVYLCTEDKSIVRNFLAEFPDKCITVNREFYESQDNETYITDIINQHINPREAGELYLKQIYMLQHCNAAILSRTSALPAILFDSKFENTYIWDLGVYGFDD